MLVPDQQLAENFWLHEFCVSKDHPGLAAQLLPIEFEINNLYLLSNTILQPVRTYFDKWITIKSGYRDFALNPAVGGSETSLHRFGKAADFTVADPDLLREIYSYIKEVLPFAYGQLRWYRARSFIHVALPHDGANRFCQIKD